MCTYEIDLRGKVLMQYTISRNWHVCVQEVSNEIKRGVMLSLNETTVVMHWCAQITEILNTVQYLITMHA